MSKLKVLVTKRCLIINDGYGNKKSFQTARYCENKFKIITGAATFGKFMFFCAVSSRNFNVSLIVKWVNNNLGLTEQYAHNFVRKYFLNMIIIENSI